MAFDTDFKKSANNYLYIFISPTAKMDKAIMTRRANQIARLRQIAAIPLMPGLAKLIALTREGIREQYGAEPEAVLDHIFGVAYSLHYGHGIGATFDTNGNYLPTPTGTIKATENYNPMTGKPYTSLNEVAFNKVASNGTVVKADRTFWSDVSSVVEWIVKIFNSLGITSGPKDSATFPTSDGWTKTVIDNGYMSSSASMGSTLTYVAAGGILLFLMTKTKK